MDFAGLRSKLEVLSAFHRPWFVAGGWAVDLFLGREIRSHRDIDIAIFRDDQFELRRHLANWAWEKVVNGKRVCWEESEWLAWPIHEVRGIGSEHQVEFLFNERRLDLWLYRRDQTVNRLLTHFHFQSGLPILPPEIVLLYKSKNPSERDLTDFRQVWPQLSWEARGGWPTRWSEFVR
jgi:Aminoglycoside-2''-adenylyltransferase